MLRRLAVPATVCLAVLCAFAPVVQNEFVTWDDDLNFLENTAYRGLSPSHLRWMLTTVYGGHYQPLTWLTFGLDYTLWGMNPTGYHTTNLLLHAANAVLFYVLVLALLRWPLPTAQADGSERVTAAVGALAFALHPLRVESVAWATERRDVLAGFFYLLTLLAYVGRAAAERAGRPGGRWLAASLGCFVLSLASKAWGITLPVVLLVLDWYPLRRGRHLLEKVPYAVLALVSLAATLVAFDTPSMRPLAQHGVLERAAQAAYGLVFYLCKTAVPVGLSPLYLLEPKLDPTAPRYVLAALGALGVTIVAVWWRRRRPWLLAAWVAYGVIVSPVLGFIQNGPQIVADRYSYLACLPWAVLVAAAVRRSWTAPVAATVAVGLVVLGGLTFRQTQVWRSSQTLWERAIEIDPQNWLAHTNRGVDRMARGDLEGALADYDAAVTAHPGYFLAYYNRAAIRLQRGDATGTIADLDAVIALQPHDAALAGAYYNRGTMRFEQEDDDGAIADFTALIELRPGGETLAKAWNNRGLARQSKGDNAGAAVDFTEALRVAPPGWSGRAQIEENLAAAQETP